MKSKILVWLLKKAFESKMRKKLESTIRELYRKMACESLILEQKIIKVKKGKIRYELIFFETKNGILKCNLGRKVTANSRVTVVI